MRRGSSPLSALDATYIEGLYARFRSAPEQLDESWRCLFGMLDLIEESAPYAGGGADAAQARRAALLAGALRCSGHLQARLDPLAGDAPLHRPDAYEDIATRDGRPGLSVEAMRELYCGTLALETGHIDDRALAAWLQDRFEAPEPPPAAEEQVQTLHDLIEADEFERFMGRKFTAKKRFGVEGAEAILTLLRAALRRAAEAGVESVVIGTMHRGRLNLMTNLLGRSPGRLFAEIKGAHPFPADPPRPGDVPYHLGHAAPVETGAGTVAVTLLANPSHLEAVDPLVLGSARALQDARGDGGGARVLPIVIHTDAAVVGQGVVAETLQLGGTVGFGTAGALHIVINNQIGFTTEPREARTSRHCTGPWKAIDSAILHVNADDPAAARRAARIAVDWRQTHARDAVIDLVCYRRNGHNEIDEPTFTQPLLYQAIKRHEPVAQAEAKRLVAAGVLTEDEVEAHAAAYRARLQNGYDNAGEARINESGYPPAPEALGSSDTGFDTDRLRTIGATLAQPPAGVALHDRMDRILRQRAVGDAGIAWPTAEGLAFGSLLLEGVGVRLTGQDVVRGAFSHRHFALADAETGALHVGLAALPGARAPFAVHNSPLSEYAVLGFEYGYSLQRPGHLVVWEAQFGDFANGAQIVIDQFIAAGEAKWCVPSALVLLLPHGLEGQGPEHSSARIERFLQLAAGDNIRVANPSTPANYFHLLRRQTRGMDRRPLVVMSPKRLLRLGAAVSALAEFAPGTAFLPLIVGEGSAPVRRILLCSGKIAYELEAERDRRGTADVAVARLEELYPLPTEPLLALFRRWPDAICVWVQEEPENMGAWSWLDSRLHRLRAQAGSAAPAPLYAGRPESASPAGSFHGAHDDDQAAIVASAFDLEA